MSNCSVNLQNKQEKSFDVVFFNCIANRVNDNFLYSLKVIERFNKFGHGATYASIFKGFKAKKNKGYQDLSLVGNSHFFKE